MFVTSWEGDDEKGRLARESAERQATLDAGVTARTNGGRRAMFAADSDPDSICFVLEDGPAGHEGECR